MKSLKKFVLTILLTLLMTSICLWAASRLFIPKWIDEVDNRITYIIKGFYEEPKNSIDVLFTGNSDVYRGISPMEIYDQTGITSYNFVSPGQRIWVAYAMLEEALRYQSPKVVFFNIDEIYYTSAGVGNAHKVYDNMKFGIPKLKGILDPNYQNENRLSHLLPIFSYHDRYKELSLLDFEYAFADYTDYLKCMDLVATKEAYESVSNYMEESSDIATIPDKNLAYLDKMVELCEKNNIEFVIFEIPSPDSWNYKKHNAVQEYAEKNDLKFLDMNLYLNEIGIDWSQDTADGGDHLNIFGAEKVSAYLSEYLKNFNLTNHKEDKDYVHWNDHYEKYSKYKNEAIDNLQS